MELRKVWLRVALLAGALVAVAFGLSACYRSHIRPDPIPGTAGRVWTGTGKVREGGSSGAPPQALGLAGPITWWSPTFDRPDTPRVGVADAGLPLPPGYFLTGLTQRISTVAQETWLHAEVSSGPPMLALFRGTGAMTMLGFSRIEPADGVGIIQRDGTYPIKTVCDVAGVDDSSGEFTKDRLYLSVTAQGPSGLVGALVEATEQPLGRWNVRTAAGGVQQAAIAGVHGEPLPPECMPIATTGLGDPFDFQYVAIASPFRGDFLIFRAGALDAGPTGAQRITKPGLRPVDLILMRASAGTAALVVLWKGPTRALVEAYQVTAGSLSPSPLQSDNVTPSAMFIESPQWVTGTNRDIYLFAPEGIYTGTVDLTGL
jgi:hypothetical protein